jgi:hypothetical protein
MAIYHLSVKAISRSAGRSATAAAAYRAGVEITDTRTGEVHDYTRKRGIVSADLVLPAGAPEWAADRSALWNAAEHAERRKDACVAREYEVALPSELPAEARRELAVAFAKELADREGCAVDVCIHEPSKGGDNRNHHAHIMRTTRQVGAEGLEAKLDTEKAGRNRAADLEAVRAKWAELTNEHLRRHGIEATVDHRSLKTQGIDREPTQHLGPTATAIERRTGQASRKRQDFDQDMAERLARAKQAGELQRQGQVLERSILDLSGDLAAAKAERDQLAALAAAEAQKRAIEASRTSVDTQYVQALKNVTNETLATVPGLLPPQAVQNALIEVYREEKAKVDLLRDVDVEMIRNLVIEQPAQQGRLAQADSLDAEARAELQEIATRGAIKRRLSDTKGDTERAEQKQAKARTMRAQVSELVEGSPEVRQTKQINEQNQLTRRRFDAEGVELQTALERVRKDKSLWDQPRHVFRLPEVFDRVLDKARNWASKMVKGMLPAEVEQMTVKAVDVAWVKQESQHAIGQMQSRFVLPVIERRQHQEREQASPKQGKER